MAEFASVVPGLQHGFTSTLPGEVITEKVDTAEIVGLHDHQTTDLVRRKLSKDIQAPLALRPWSQDQETQPRLSCSTPPLNVQYEQVLRWLLDADASEASLVIAQVRKHRPELFVESGGIAAVRPVINGVGERSVDQGTILRTAVERDPLEMLKLDAECARKEPPMVQFSCFMYFCNETESSMRVDVMRIGDLSGHSEVRYSTRDGTAKAGSEYEATSGKLLFGPGENEQKIDIPLIKNSCWDTTTEFIIELNGEPAPVGCTLGRYLWMARIKVIDDDFFPSNRHRVLIESQEMDKVPKWSLLYDYIKLNWSFPVVKRGTIKMLISDFLHNMYFFSQLLMNVYLVDKVVKGNLEKPIVPLLLIATVLVLPFFFLHILDFRRQTWKVGGASRAMLQKALMRKFLNYAEESRVQLQRSDLVMAMTRDVTNLVDDGYSKFIVLFKLGGQIFFLLLFQVVAPLLFGKPPSHIPFVVFFTFPLLQISFLFLRRTTTVHYVSSRNAKQDELVAQIDRTVTNYRMIADYNRRPFFVDRYSSVIGEFNGAAVQAALVLKNNAYFPQWVSILSVAIYIVVGGMRTIDKPESLTLGMFLANVKILSTIGSVMGSVYATLLDMQNSFPALLKVVDLLNLPTDVPQRMLLNRARREATTALRKSAMHTAATVPIDSLPIQLEDISYSYSGTGVAAQVVQCKGKLEIQQGEMVTLIGPRGEGKSTLLRLIGSVILPKPEGYFVPSHLRVLHISSEPLFFLGSLYENLSFGVTPGDDDADITRVLSIVHRLGVSDNVLSLIDIDDKSRTPWGEVLSYTQQCLLCLARAFIANAELMCVHKPTMPFDEFQSETVMQLFREYCDKKGVEQDNALRHRRRPRTSVITSSKLVGVNFANRVYLVNSNDGIKSVEKDQVNGSMLY